MTDVGALLAAVGAALLLVPLADVMGGFTYFLFGGSLVLVASVLSFAPDVLDLDTDTSRARNCPTCGSPNDGTPQPTTTAEQASHRGAGADSDG